MEPDELALPRGVTKLHPDLRYRSLRSRHPNVVPTQVIAVFSDATTSATLAALDQSKRIAELSGQPSSA